MTIAEYRLEHGAKYPYDGGSAFCIDECPNPPPATDWAHAAARGVLADLLDRRGIKWAFEDEEIDHDTRKEIVESLAEIIRLAAAAKGVTT
jgi:hypothetical protein